MNNFTLPPDVENDILEEVIQEYVAQMHNDDDLKDAFPGGLLPTMSPLPPQERLARYTTMTHPDDINLMLDPEYIKKYQAGLLPAPLSPFWLNQLRMPTLFAESQRDMRSLWRHNFSPLFNTEGNTSPIDNAGLGAGGEP